MVEEYATVTNPFAGRKDDERNMSKNDDDNKVVPANAKRTPDVKKGIGTGALALVGGGSAIAARAGLVAAVNAGKLDMTTASAIQTGVGLVLTVGLAAMGFERLGAALGGGHMAIGGADLIETLRLRSMQTPGATGTPAVTATPAPTTANPGGRLPAQVQGQRLTYGPQQRVATR